MQRFFLAESDHLFRERTDGLGLGEGGFDSAMFDQTADLIGQERVTMRLAASEFNRFALMSHELSRGCAVRRLMDGEIGVRHGRIDQT
jgi:hypothetical protein